MNMKTLKCPSCKQTIVKSSGKYPNGKRDCPVCHSVKGVTYDAEFDWATSNKKNLSIAMAMSCDQCAAAWTEVTTFKVGTYKNVCFGGDC
jgi:phage FluMu protein Com